MTGILLLDKPRGWTSHDAVAKLRGALHERRIGHAGTLDPMATGLLVVLIGRATRAMEFAEAQDKRYLAGFRPGLVTDTQDTTGTVLRTAEPDFSDAELREALAAFCGEIWQTPPMYSAIKQNGRKLYEIARKGGEVERKARRIEIGRLELAGRDGGDYLLDVICSKGTYIRTLCHDLGAALGCGGCMSALRRLRSGAFSVGTAHTMETVLSAAEAGSAQSLLLPTDSLFRDLPAFTADGSAEKKIRSGAAFQADAPAGQYRVYSETGEFLALGGAENGKMRAVRSFFEVDIT